MPYWNNEALNTPKYLNEEIEALVKAIPAPVLFVAAIVFSGISAVIISLWVIGQLALRFQSPQPVQVEEDDAIALYKAALAREIARSDGLQQKLDILEREINERHDVLTIGGLTVSRNRNDDRRSGGNPHH